METNHVFMQNIKEEATAIFKTIILTKQQYGMNYLVRLIRGDKRFELKKAEHETLETFGSMMEVTEHRLKNIITWLLKSYYLTIVNLQYGSLGLTAKAYLLMNTEEELLVNKEALQTTAEDRVLGDSLKKIRKAIAETESKPQFNIFTDWALQNLIDSKPIDMESLKAMQVIGESYVDTYGYLILKAIASAKEDSKSELENSLYKRIKSLAYQTVKDLFLSGQAIEEIATLRQIKTDTVLTYLGDLHRTGEIDMKPWIEQKVNKTTLQKVEDFFAQEGVSFKDAYHNLGLDYQTLLLAKFYISPVTPQHTSN